MSSPDLTGTAQTFERKLNVSRSNNGAFHVDCDDTDGRTALAVACLIGNPKLVKDLLDQRAALKNLSYAHNFTRQIREKTHYQTVFDRIIPSEEPLRSKILKLVEGQTPLICAAQEGHTDIAQMLLDSGEDVNEESPDGIAAPLHWAAGNGHVEIVDLLLRQGANVEAVTADGHTPLFMAARMFQVAVVDHLLDKYKPDVNVQDRTGSTALLVLVDTPATNTHQIVAQRKIMKRLIQEGCDIDARKDTTRYTALIEAALQDRVDLMKLLLEWGADVDCQGVVGLTALCSAAAVRNPVMVKLLLDYNAKSTIPGPRTPVEHALMCDHPLAGEFMHTGDRDLLLVLELLLKHNPDELTSKRSKAMEEAISHHNLEVVRLLLEYPGCERKLGALNMPPVCVAANNGEGAMVRLMIERGMSPHQTDDHYGRNALIWTVSQGQQAAFTELLQTPGIEFSRSDNLGRTALFYAAVHGHEGMFKELRSRGSRVHQADCFGITPLVAAVQHGHVNLVRQILLNHPIKQEPKDRFGRTLSWWMLSTNNTDMRSLLVLYGVPLGDDAQVNPDHFYPDKEKNRWLNVCDVCTLHLARHNRGIECGSGSKKFRICQICLSFGATSADFGVK